MALKINRTPLDDQRAIINRKLDERLEIKVSCDSDNQSNVSQRAIAYDLASQDSAEGFIFFCNNFVFIQDPEAPQSKDKDIPFLLYDFQDQAAAHIISAINSGYDLPIEKSRKMGLSWLLMTILVWGWHFHKWDCLVGSQKAENVDKRGNMKSLLEKSRYILDKTPDWLIPTLDPKFHDKNMNLVHPTHGATLAGESNNTNFGRSDRRKVILFDEFSSWELTDKAAWQSCGSTSPCRIPLSTPNTRGTSCHFYTICTQAHKENKPILRLHWSLHPVFAKELYHDDLGRPRSPWYDEQCKRSSSPQEVSQELDIDYEASMGGKVFPEFKMEVNTNDDIVYNPDLPLFLGVDFGLDQTALVWVQPDLRKNKVYIIDEYISDGEGDGTSIYHYVDIMKSKPYKKPVIYCDPHSGENHNMTSGDSNANILRRKFSYQVVSSRGSISERILAGRNLLPKVVISSVCTYTIDMFVSWQFQRPKSGNQNSQTPQHNTFSHIGDAYTYFAVNFRSRSAIKPAKRRDYSLSPSGVMI